MAGAPVAGCVGLPSLAGQRPRVARVVGEGHLYGDGPARVGVGQGVGGARRAWQLLAVGQPLVGEDGVVQAPEVGDAGGVGRQGLTRLDRAGDDGQTRGLRRGLCCLLLARLLARAAAAAIPPEIALSHRRPHPRPAGVDGPDCVVRPTMANGVAVLRFRGVVDVSKIGAIKILVFAVPQMRREARGAYLVPVRRAAGLRPRQVGILPLARLGGEVFRRGRLLPRPPGGQPLDGEPQHVIRPAPRV